MKIFSTKIVSVLKRDVMKVIMFTRNFKSSRGVDLGDSMKRIYFRNIITLL